jgi:hypothetical protein
MVIRSLEKLTYPPPAFRFVARWARALASHPHANTRATDGDGDGDGDDRI